MERKIRALHLIDSFDLGGAQTAICQFLDHRDRNKVEVVLAACHGNQRSVFLPRVGQLGCEVVCLSPFRWLPLYCLTLPWLIATRRFDVVHCHLFVSNWTGKILAKIFRVPVIISHDHSYDRFRFDWAPVRWWDGWSNRCADAIFVISTYIKDNLVRREKVGSGQDLRIEERGSFAAQDYASSQTEANRCSRPLGKLEEFFQVSQVSDSLEQTGFRLPVHPGWRWTISSGVKSGSSKVGSRRANPLAWRRS